MQDRKMSRSGPPGGIRHIFPFFRFFHSAIKSRQTISAVLVFRLQDLYLYLKPINYKSFDFRPSSDRSAQGKTQPPRFTYCSLPAGHPPTTAAVRLQLSNRRWCSVCFTAEPHNFSLKSGCAKLRKNTFKYSVSDVCLRHTDTLHGSVKRRKKYPFSWEYSLCATPKLSAGRWSRSAT